MTANGLEKQPGIFISRLVPGGLAEGTGLLAVNDEVLEVNGIEVAGKSLDQVGVVPIITGSFWIFSTKMRSFRKEPSSPWKIFYFTPQNIWNILYINYS